jgi:hypothetical protein
MSRPEEEKTSPLVLAAAWIVVLIPLAWGVYQTAVKSLPLFRAADATERPASGIKHAGSGSGTADSVLRRDEPVPA